jgi:hypothetical protein
MKTILIALQTIIFSLFIIPKNKSKFLDFSDMTFDFSEDDLHNINQELKQME